MECVCNILFESEETQLLAGNMWDTCSLMELEHS